MTTDGNTSCGGSADVRRHGRQDRRGARCRWPATRPRVPAASSVNGHAERLPDDRRHQREPGGSQRGRHRSPSRRRRTTATRRRSRARLRVVRRTAARSPTATRRSPTFTCNTPGMRPSRVTVSDGDPACRAGDHERADQLHGRDAKTPGTYVAGDFHNHTTCSDGSISMQKLIKKATDKRRTRPGASTGSCRPATAATATATASWSRTRRLATPVYPFVGAPPAGPHPTRPGRTPA